MGGALAWRPALRLGPSSVPREPCACGGWTGLGGAADRGRDDGGCSPEDGMLDFLLDVKGDVIGLIVCRRLFFLFVLLLPTLSRYSYLFSLDFLCSFLRLLSLTEVHLVSILK